MGSGQNNEIRGRRTATVAFVVGTIALRLRLERSHSLKDKRQVLRSLKDRLKKRHNVSVAEVDDLDSWQDSVVVAAAVSTSASGVRHALDTVYDSALRVLGRDLVDSDVNILEL